MEPIEVRLVILLLGLASMFAGTIVRRLDRGNVRPAVPRTLTTIGLVMVLIYLVLFALD